MPGFATSRSTTASIVCFFFLSRRISSSSESTMPSTRTRVKPALRTCSRTSRCSPLRSFTSGASTRNFVPSGQLQRSRATICCADCCETGRPQLVAGEPAHAGPEHAQVVVDLGDGADGGARVARSPPSARSRWWGRGRGSSRRAACPSARGTAGRRRTGSRCSGAGPRRRGCRRRASDLPEPETPVRTTSFFFGISTVTFLRLCWRAPVMTMRSSSIWIDLERKGTSDVRTSRGSGRVPKGQRRREDGRGER